MSFSNDSPVPIILHWFLNIFHSEKPKFHHFIRICIFYFLLHVFPNSVQSNAKGHFCITMFLLRWHSFLFVLFDFRSLRSRMPFPSFLVHEQSISFFPGVTYKRIYYFVYINMSLFLLCFIFKNSSKILRT